MTDVRLTATNPVDSTVVPVACNDKGELLVENPIGPGLYVEKAGDNMTGDLTLGGDKIKLDAGDGTAEYVGSIRAHGFVSPSGVDFNLESHYQQGTIGTSRGAGVFRLSDEDGTQGPQQAMRITQVGLQPADAKIAFYYNGNAELKGDVIVGSGGDLYQLVEQDGICHMVQQSFLVSDESRADGGLALRNIQTELTMIEQQLQKVIEHLNLPPNADWSIFGASNS